MASVKKDTTINEYQDFVREVYGLNNDRYFNTEGMLIQIQRFAMQALKGIRKNVREKTKLNLIISISWFISLMDQLHIKLEEEIWRRFPYLCSYCATSPCSCAVKHPTERKERLRDESKRPKTLAEFQIMFEKIYPAESRTLEHAGVHLAEELGEFSEAILLYSSQHQDKDFEIIILEAADLFSCFMGVFNSIKANYAEELALLFSENCYVCKKAPCECTFEFIMRFKFN